MVLVEYLGRQGLEMSEGEGGIEEKLDKEKEESERVKLERGRRGVYEMKVLGEQPSSA